MTAHLADRWKRDRPQFTVERPGKRTVRVNSGGATRDRLLDPIVARVRSELIALAAEHGNRGLDKYSPDQPRDDHGRWAEAQAALASVSGQSATPYPDVARYADGYAAAEAEKLRREGVPLGSAPNSGDVHITTEAEAHAGYLAWDAQGDIPGAPRYDKPFHSPGDATVIYRGPDGRPAGFIAMATHDGKTGITLAWVDPSERGKGIATAMYDWAQDKGGIDLYRIVGAAASFTPEGKAFTEDWLRHRIAVESSR